MTSMSPLSDKVNAFLSSISTLSQERLREDQERERLLQRNIDELRFSLRQGSPHKLSTFGSLHSAAYDRVNDDIPGNLLDMELSFKQIKSETPPPKPKRPPQLPARPSGSVADNKRAPALPRRRCQEESEQLDSNRETEDTPPLPRRRDGPVSFDIDLIQPIARSNVSRNPKPARFPEPMNTAIEELRSKRNGKLRSFLDMETEIKLGDTNTIESSKISRESKEMDSSPSASSKNSSNEDVTRLLDKPKKAPKPSYLAYQAKNSSGDSHDSSKNTIKSKVMTKPQTRNIETTRKASDSLESTLNKTIESKKHPKVVPEKKTSLPAFKTDKTTAELSEQHKIVPLKKPPIPAKPALKNFVEKDEEFLKNLKNNLGQKPPKPRKPSVGLQARNFNEKLNDAAHNKESEQIPEALAQLNKIKMVSATSSQVTDIKKDKTITRKSLMFESSLDLSTAQPLRTQLSSLLKAKSFPLSSGSTLAPTPCSMEKAEKKQDTPSVKLSHTNKQRSKGPRRRLPKSISKASLKNTTPVAEKVLQEDATKEIKERIDSKKTPPPVNKNKKPSFTRPLKARLEAGEEVFI